VTPTEIVIAARFNGPPGSANGGYVCGLIAVATGEQVKVRLHQPPPLEVPLVVESVEPGTWRVRHELETVATATQTAVELDPPAVPGYLAALEISKHYAGFAQHAYPRCFVCGPQRAIGDGLRIFAGPRDGTDQVVAPWLPHPDLGDAAGKVRPQFIWAALDCPGYFAFSSDGRRALLGELAVHIDRLVRIEKPCIVAGWPISCAGRKHRVATALYDEDGVPVARGLATWIELPDPV
jgi:hypothetical protein